MFTLLAHYFNIFFIEQFSTTIQELAPQWTRMIIQYNPCQTNSWNFFLCDFWIICSLCKFYLTLSHLENVLKSDSCTYDWAFCLVLLQFLFCSKYSIYSSDNSQEFVSYLKVMYSQMDKKYLCILVTVFAILDSCDDGSSQFHLIILSIRTLHVYIHRPTSTYLS